MVKLGKSSWAILKESNQLGTEEIDEEAERKNTLNWVKRMVSPSMLVQRLMNVVYSFIVAAIAIPVAALDALLYDMAWQSLGQAPKSITYQSDLGLSNHGDSYE